ncbi:hypothetical protein T459_14054 [Capsicum annuum]|uniref:Glycosyltransferase N-terminal domain-containing protein n=1 Tax=Capsicum annuum TaxID=4072 RepID=A0A2G2ZGA1_CAPAN|nr:hypothetical protein T459_14054 [Capsicum annuum]
MCSNLKQDEVAIVLVPFPAQGHLNQLLQLACLISSSYDLPPLWDASMLLRESISSFLRDISTKARCVVVVHDSLMSYNVLDVTSLHKAESYIFNCISVFTLYCFMSLSMGISVQLDEELLKKLPSLEGIVTDKIKNLGASHSPYMDIRSGDIHNTSKVIEGEFLDLLAQIASKQEKKQWAIGPILPTN